MTPSHECLYDVAWQKQRLGYVDRFTTEQEVRENISSMLAYIGKAQDRYWKFIRVWRCTNTMNHAIAVAEKHNNLVGLHLLKVFRKGLEIEFRRYKDASRSISPFRKWSWAKVAADLSRLYESDRELFQQLRAYSERRLFGGGKVAPLDPASNPELTRFVRMMRDTEFDHG